MEIAHVHVALNYVSVCSERSFPNTAFILLKYARNFNGIFILKALKNMDVQTEQNFTLDPPCYGNICLS